ncbi:MBL fold metallo-hydrolase [Streptomyces violaceusniger]|uniref:Beta-lactamase domain protein n=1 Tax=Streptomyces violaceusniger (strain Tu 4113) TaxID=653045 RepID=G2P7Q1_STRV4|nr:MBL fold metallo-hydrolase [Streptomyces violaceusniger]AEM87363.1 beta-lactamase domain protein [Streptomyces violaceusniger Tu 4113]
MDSITLGDVHVTRVVEFETPTRPPGTMFEDIPPQVWDGNRSWLAPDHWDHQAGLLMTRMQTFVLRSEGATILVDTGVGNDKARPSMPLFDHRSTDYLVGLAAAGVAPEDVDVVVNTHLHADHVGWNTRLVGGAWEPTFPNARYLMPRADYEFLRPGSSHTSRTREVNEKAFADSVAPVLRSGQAVLWEDSHDIDGALRLEYAPGHTPGSSVLTLRSGDERAVFVGDLLHNPVQIIEPDANSCFCEDPAAARASRRRVLDQAADQNALVFPAHLRGRSAVRISRRGSSYDIQSWAPFAERA